MTDSWILFKLVLSDIMAKMKCEYRKAWADENDQVWMRGSGLQKKMQKKDQMKEEKETDGKSQ